MKFEWSPALGPLGGAFLFLSASVPHPERNKRFLTGPLEEALMLRVIDQRVNDAVQSLLAQTLNAGGRIVHGGHPKILIPVAHQATQWKIPEGVEPPIRIYQSEFFLKHAAPPGREEMVRAGVGTVRWVSTNLSQIAEQKKIPPDLITRHLSKQASTEDPPAKREALLAMRLEMLLDSQPTSAICIGGMEGIEAETRLYLELAKMGRIPGADHIHVMGSTYGAAANLEGEDIRFADQMFSTSSGAGRAVTFDHTLKVDLFNAPMGFVGEPESASEREAAFVMPADPDREAAYRSTPETAYQDLRNRLSYDGVMRSLVERIASNHP